MPSRNNQSRRRKEREVTPLLVARKKGVSTIHVLEEKGGYLPTGQAWHLMGTRSAWQGNKEPHARC